ncbi:MAG TPA: hypothetical protein VFY82_07985 [Acidimicrobiales bacterium]|nr:hypothetical protein [Acidimicrobiales bacterium]
MAGFSVDNVTDAVENTVFTAVGLGILGFQHLQVQRRSLERTVSATVRQLAEQVDRTVKAR